MVAQRKLKAMIKVLLSGGMGNQMFQYAAGRALSERLGVPLYLDTFCLTKKTKATRRLFGLDMFEAAESYRFSTGVRNKLFVKCKPFFTKHKNLR
ncbi:MAG: hypothetical protein LBR34_01890, partial [Prevotella sp.]|nr:hypothetical protein [Prevotella sp.]